MDSTASGRVDGLARMLAPRSIAVVGASDDPSRIGGRVLANVVAAFDGPVYPVSRTRDRVQGIAAVSELGKVTDDLDLVIVAVAGSEVGTVVDAAAAKSVAGVIVLSAGFAETGADGAREQQALVRVARQAGTRLLGPNTIGFMAPRRGIYATFLHNAVEETVGAPVALITQSGAMGAYLLRLLRAAGLGFEIMCATGNEADISTTELVEHVVGDETVDTVLVCMEGTRDVDRLIRAGRRARSLGKTILLLKIGTSDAGRRAAQSHSGAVSSSADAFSAALRHAGIVEVETIEGLARFGPLLRGGRRATGNRLGILTTSGGLGIHAADRAARLGIEVPTLPEADRQRIGSSLPSFASAANPVDVTGNVINNIESLRAAAVGMMTSDGIDIGLVYATNVGAQLHEAAFSAIAAAYHAGTKPMVALAHDAVSARALMDRGVFAVDDLELAIGAVNAMVQSADLCDEAPRRPLDGDDPAVVTARGLLGSGGPLQPDAGFQLLEAFGIAAAEYAVAYSVDEAVVLAPEVGGGPVALKLAVAELAHKSDVGGVIIGLTHPAAIGAAAARLLRIAAEQGVPGRLLIQRMAPAGTELFVGMYRAEGIGPVLVVGVGGVLVEIIAETQTVLAVEPDERLRAAVARLCQGRLTAHVRGLSTAALDAVEVILSRVATLALSLPEVEQLDLNPVIVSGDAVFLVDVVCIAAHPAADAGLRA